jgi:hypothetical protein
MEVPKVRSTWGFAMEGPNELIARFAAIFRWFLALFEAFDGESVVSCPVLRGAFRFGGHVA